MFVDPERGGNVSNGVYSCGTLVHGRMLPPYAMDGNATTVATVKLDALIAAMA